MKKKINWGLWIPLVICLGLIIWGIMNPYTFELVANTMNSFITDKFGWWYVLLMTIFVVFIIWIGLFSEYKNIRLGDDDTIPEYTLLEWFTMLFSAGMGIGLVFWGTAEPLNYYVNPLNCEPGSSDAIKFALTKSFLHWGIHPWANYAVLALALSYFWYRKKMPYLISSIVCPFFKNTKVSSVVGKIVDILAVIATVAGVSTSLGLGSMQINSGLNKLFGIPEDSKIIVAIIITISCCYIFSALLGIKKGIRILSNTNVVLCIVIALACFVVGPTSRVVNSALEGTGLYLGELFQHSLEIGAFENHEWYGGWTIFYWAWWIAWAPFTATFIARISKGRTIKEFCLGIVFIPALVSIVWFSIFGILGINMGLDVASEAIKNTSTALFVVLENYPGGYIISVIVIVLLCTFFITSADSATFVLGMLTSNGVQNPSNKKKIMWGAIIAFVALSLMLFTENGLNMLQTMSIVGAFPFSFVMVGAIVSLIKKLKDEK